MFKPLTRLTAALAVTPEMRRAVKEGLDTEIVRRFASSGDGQWPAASPVTDRDREERRRYYGRVAPGAAFLRQGVWSGHGMDAMLAKNADGTDSVTPSGFRREIAARSMKSFNFGRKAINADWPAASGPQPARPILGDDSEWLKKAVERHLEPILRKLGGG